MKLFLTSLLDWIYKKKCYFCRSSKESIRMCSKCYDELEFLPCEVNRKVLSSDIYCAGVYDKNLQKLIRGLKYHRQKDLAYFQAKFMWEYWQNLNLDGDFIIIPVPIYEKREKQRKYNHMELVAKEFSKLSGYEVCTNLIERIKDTKPQYKLNKAQRMLNLANAFRVKTVVNTDKKLLIIDDICTTGSTFEQMISELRKSSINNDIICFATTTPFGA